MRRVIDIPEHGSAEYTKAELDAMRGLPWPEVRLIHLLKAEFPGSTLSAPDNRGSDEDSGD